jgi:hypothetical protein
MSVRLPGVTAVTSMTAAAWLLYISPGSGGDAAVQGPLVSHTQTHTWPPDEAAAAVPDPASAGRCTCREVYRSQNTLATGTAGHWQIMLSGAGVQVGQVVNPCCLGNGA